MSKNQQLGPPPRWLNCPRKSDTCIADKFLVFKTPLSSKYDDQIPIGYRFTPKMILEHIAMKKLKIGLWIDLTNTDRFYSSQSIPNTIKYIKLNCRGHGECPNLEQTNKFINICKLFIKTNDIDIICVHCTHGYNRSGFLIISFLIEEFDFSIEAAINLFSKLRPPGIYKQDYMNELYKRYQHTGDLDNKNLNILLVGDRPSWCFDDEEEEEEVEEKINYNEPERKKRKKLNGKEFKKLNPIFMAGIDNVIPIINNDELLRIQKKVQHICHWDGNGFPGSQPISMDINNIQLLTISPYLVSWKADGTRYLLLIENIDKIYFIDRDNSVFIVKHIHFPSRKGLHLKETLCDGEMVMDEVDNIKIPRFLIYDIIQFDGKETGKIDFRRRLSCIKDEIVTPRYEQISKGLIDRTKEPFGVRLKDFWPIEYTEKILNGSLQLPHEPDGCIFQPQLDPYMCGRCDQVLKWKPPELNTIDFRLKICTIEGEGILRTRIGELYVGQLQTPFGHLKPINKKLAELDGKIIECRFDGKNWCFLRERIDKSFPNAYTTATAVAFSISNPVRKDWLLDFICRKRFKL